MKRKNNSVPPSLLAGIMPLYDELNEQLTSVPQDREQPFRTLIHEFYQKHPPIKKWVDDVHEKVINSMQTKLFKKTDEICARCTAPDKQHDECVYFLKSTYDKSKCTFHRDGQCTHTIEQAFNMRAWEEKHGKK